jgi:cyclopropane fatty-acyl-phospholipid synthase-like methyltransferase
MKLVRGRVLDIGCGAGRHSLYLQKRRFDVMGIDNSPLAVKVCKARGVKKVKNMSIADIGKFKPHSFDTVIMLGNNFGLFGGMERGRKLLRKLYRITSPGARIIAESTNPYKTKNQDYLWYHKFNRKRGRMGGQLRFRLLFKKCVGEWFDYLLVSKDEMKEILKSTGWKAGKFIDSSGPSYIAVIRKNQ